MEADSSRRALALVFVVPGLLVAVAFLFWGIMRHAGRRHWKRAEGEVVDMKADTSGGYSPVVEFETSPGQKQSFDGNVVTDPPRYRVGEHVAVLFDPSEPSTAMIDRALEHYFVPGLFSGMGLLFALAGLFIWLWR